MKIKYLAHACFLITSNKGIRIITDPYTTGKGTALSYAEVQEPADIVTISHGHGDHSNEGAVGGRPVVIKSPQPTQVKGISVRGIPTYHDDAGGKLRGNNIVFCFEVDGIRVCHLGDLGERLKDTQIKEIGKVDLLLIPVGGLFTIDAKAATQVCNDLAPRVAIPMHFKTEKSSHKIAGVDDFVKDKKNAQLSDLSELELSAGKLPASSQIIVLKPSR